MAMYAFSLHRPKFSLKFPKNIIPVLKYSSLILIAASVATVLLDLDKVMIEHYLPIENVAIYGIAIYIATVISVPQKAMHQITNPLTAEMLNKKDKLGLKDLYKKSSLNLLVVSGLIFIWIITNVEALYELIPEEYEISLLIIVMISLVKLYDNILGNNNSILFNSDYYRIVLAVGVILVLVAFGLNMLFIPEYGIEGAALASFIAFGIYNTSKIIIVLNKFNIHPFTTKSWVLLCLIAAFSLGFYYLNLPVPPIMNILIKGVISGFLYISTIYYFRFSEDINRFADSLLKKF